MRISARRVVLLLVLSGALPAQNVLVVDQSQGPGSQFVDIQSAVDAAVPGDRVLVRPGGYAGFVVDKPISIVGDPEFLVLGANANGEAVTIENLPPGTDFVLRGMDSFFLGSTEIVALRNCRGRALLDEVQSALGAVIEDCAQVLVNRCIVTGLIAITRSAVTITDSGCVGTPTLFFASEALRLIDSTVWVSRSDVVGGGALVMLPTVPGSAFVLSNSTLTLSDDGTHAVRAGISYGTPTQVPTIQGDGTLRMDPDVQLLALPGAPLIAGAITTTTENVPTMVATGAQLGGQASVELQSDPGDSYFLILGFPGDALPIPSLQGSLWVKPSQSVVAAAGALDATGRASSSYGVPNITLFAGLPAVWVGIAGSSRLRLSNHAGVTFSP